MKCPVRTVYSVRHVGWRLPTKKVLEYILKGCNKLWAVFTCVRKDTQALNTKRELLSMLKANENP